MIPYENATSGQKARGEIVRTLQLFGAESVGFMDDFSTNTLLLAFEFNGQNVQLRASAQGWAAMYLRANPWSSRRREGRQGYEQRCLEQGLIAINSILRDWVKGQITAIETGILTFEHVFLPYMLTDNGQTVGERIKDLPLFLDSAR